MDAQYTWSRRLSRSFPNYQGGGREGPRTVYVASLVRHALAARVVTPARLAEAFEEQVLRVAKVIRCMEGDVAAVAAEVERLQGRKRHLAGRIEWLRRYLVKEMEAVGREKVRGATMTVSLGKGPPSCEVVNPEDVPEEYRRVKVEVDRAAILENFRSTGEVVPRTTVISDRRYVRIS